MVTASPDLATTIPSHFLNSQDQQVIHYDSNVRGPWPQCHGYPQEISSSP